MKEDLSRGGTVRVFEIEGKQFTAKTFHKETGISIPACYHRLKTARTLEELYQHKKTNRYGSMCKQYVVDGQTFTIREVAEKLGVTESTARYRINNSNTVEELFKPVSETCRSTGRSRGESSECYGERPVKMIEDAMFKLIMKAVA